MLIISYNLPTFLRNNKEGMEIKYKVTVQLKAK